MQENKDINKKNENDKPKADNKKHFIQLLDIKEDKNMTRIYSAISQTSFFNLISNNN